MITLGRGHAALGSAEIGDKDINALSGGIHVFTADQQTASWTGFKLMELGLKHLLAGQCTGIKPMLQSRQALDKDRSQAVMRGAARSFSLANSVVATHIFMQTGGLETPC